MDISGIFKHIVSITQFNKGKASQLFSRANRGESLLVIKNNVPVAVILSPEEYEVLCKFPKICSKACKNGNNINVSEIVDLLNQLRSFDEKEENDV